MPKVVVNNEKGLVQYAGSGLVVNSAASFNVGLQLGSETVTDAGAISTSKPLSLLVSSSGATVPTLADGTNIGQLKYLIMTDDSGTSQTVTPTTTSGAWASLAFSVAGQTATLVWDGGGWAIMSRASGATAGATAVAGLAVIA
jgi:hypothetical protein